MSETLALNPYASKIRPVLAGRAGAVSAAHPLAAAAAQEALAGGGGAVDAVIAAQAVLAVVAPDACGLGGDGFYLVREPQGAVVAVNGAGAAALAATRAAADGGPSVTVPGLVAAWEVLSQRWGRLTLARCLQPAIRLARSGIAPDRHLLAAVETHRPRMVASGAGDWALLSLGMGQRWLQHDLGRTLEKIAKEGRTAFYAGRIAGALVEAVQGAGGAMAASDLTAHGTEVRLPVSVTWRGAQVHVQPPVSQGVLLALVLARIGALAAKHRDRLQHLAVELTEAAFSLRDRCGEGEALLDASLSIDPDHALRRGGPRSYLHTAGVAAADRFGCAVSSLASVFDDFGSGVFVAEGGFVLNNRAGGFTEGPNAFAPGRRPIHTLAPVLVDQGDLVLALATPGADGQIQTLAQVLLAWTEARDRLAEAIAAPRWRSENGRLLIEADHPAIDELAARGHDLHPLPSGDMRFGAVTCAGLSVGVPFAVSDWRRLTWSGVA